MGLEFFDDLPPGLTRGNRLLSPEDVAELRANPGKWAKVRSYESRGSAYRAQNAAKKTSGYEGIEFRTRDGVLYAMFDSPLRSQAALGGYDPTFRD